MSVIATICYEKQQNSFLNCSNKGTYIVYNKHAQLQFYKIDTSFREIQVNERHHIETSVTCTGAGCFRLSSGKSPSDFLFEG